MSGSSRKRSSKWDLRAEPQLSPERFLPNESFTGGRDSHKDDIHGRDCNRSFDAVALWDEERNYRTRMPSGFDELRYRGHGLSPKDGWSRPVRFRSRSRSKTRSRSRSRSPGRGLRRDSGVHDRYRSMSGASPPPCRNFAVGKCRRGSHCHFSHHQDQDYEESWDSRYRKDGAPRYSAPRENKDYPIKSERLNESCINFARGRCRMGASCKFMHDEFSKGSVDELSGEREFDRQNRDNTFEHGGRHEPRHSTDTPCKFFAAGHCRNGKSCRFSHDNQADRSPNGRMRDERRGMNPGEGDQVFDGSKNNNRASPDRRMVDDGWGLSHNTADLDKVWNGPKWDSAVAVSDNGRLSEEKIRNANVALPTNDRWGNNLDKNKLYGGPMDVNDHREGNQQKADDAPASLGESRAADKWLDDVDMSPDWHYKVESTNLVKGEPGLDKKVSSQDDTYLTSHLHNITQAVSGQSFGQNIQGTSALTTSNFHMVTQTQIAPPTAPARVGNEQGPESQAGFADKISGIKPITKDASPLQFNTRITPTQNMVSKEQVTQLTNLTASLAQILGPGLQLPQFYATLQSHDVKHVHSVGNNEDPHKQDSVASTNAVPAIGLEKQYDPISDVIEPKKTDCETFPAIPPNPVGEKSAEEKPGGPSLIGRSKEKVVDRSKQTIQHPGEHMKATGAVAQDDNKNTNDDSPLENKNDGPDEGKKAKDGKGIRAFKFSLVEYVKELMKPTWKEGQISKEDYKTIVKKVVDKVTGTMQGAHIPQTQEKIDHYLSFSKPKLTKLVQAYVEKVQKA